MCVLGMDEYSVVELMCYLAFPKLPRDIVGLRHARPHLQVRPGVDMDVDVELMCVCVLGMDEYSGGARVSPRLSPPTAARHSRASSSCPSPGSAGKGRVDVDVGFPH